MNDIINRIDRVLHQLAGQQAIADAFWRPEWESIKEALRDREFEQRITGDRRRANDALAACYRVRDVCMTKAGRDAATACAVAILETNDDKGGAT